MNKKITAYAGICALLLLTGFIAGYLFPDGNNHSYVNAASLGNNSPEGSETPSEPAETPAAETNRSQDASSSVRITASTKMVYEYHYLRDGLTDRIVDTPPYFLLDYTEDALKEAFVDWLVLSFDDREVIMRKEVDSYSNQYYVVREYEGYVAVFYTTEQNGTFLKEITDSLVSVLPEDERAKLKTGINVTGNDALNRLLEDYGS